MASTVNPISLPNYAGVDFNQILQSVLAFGKIPIAGLQQQVAGETLAISVLGRIGGDLSSLQSALSSFQTIGDSAPLSASTAAGAPFTASVSGTSLSGIYSVSVNQLAAAQVSASQGYANNTDTLGTGTITVTIGGVAHDIAIDSSHQTLDGVANAINSAAIGVTAQVVNTGVPASPYRLEIASSSTGSASAFTVSTSLTGGTAPDFTNTNVGPVSLDSMAGTASPTIAGTYSGTLSQGYRFTVTSGGTVGTDAITIGYTSDSGQTGTINVASDYTPGTPITVANGLTLSLSAGTLVAGDKFSVAAFNPTIVSAQNAIVQVGNQVITSATNSVNNAIAGLTLNLTGTGGPSTVTVAEDSANEGAAISSFVYAYNKLMGDIQANTQAKPEANPPPLAANGPVQSVALGMQMGLGTINLSKLGISVNDKTGQLSFDAGAFSTALAADPTGVHNTFTQVFTALDGQITSALASNSGLIASQTASYNSLISQQNDKIATMSDQLQKQQDLLLAEYAQMQGQVATYVNIAQLFLNTSSGSGSGSSGLSSLA